MNQGNCTAQQALEKLKEGNKKYLDASTGLGDISKAVRAETFKNGQHPYAIIVTCSDSRVIPEEIFGAGIGELFVIRVAGNVIDNHQLGSIEYAADHLGCKLVVILGHTNCGAVGAAMGAGDPEGFVKFITDEIKAAIGDEKDGFKASCLNVERSISKVKESIDIEGVEVLGAIYHIEDGRVEFLG